MYFVSTKNSFSDELFAISFSKLIKGLLVNQCMYVYLQIKFQVGLVNATVDTLVFNVTCSDCNFETSEVVADKPDNLPVLGKKLYYVFTYSGSML